MTHLRYGASRSCVLVLVGLLRQARCSGTTCSSPRPGLDRGYLHSGHHPDPGSLAYSLRKRKVISWGEPQATARLPRIHRWLGSLLVLLHPDPFHRILPWLATVAMGINVISGMVGSPANRSRRHVQQQRGPSSCAPALRSPSGSCSGMR